MIESGRGGLAGNGPMVNASLSSPSSGMICVWSTAPGRETTMGSGQRCFALPSPFIAGSSMSVCLRDVVRNPTARVSHQLLYRSGKEARNAGIEVHDCGDSKVRTHDRHAHPGLA